MTQVLDVTPVDHDLLFASALAPLSAIENIGGQILYSPYDGSAEVGEIRNAGVYGYLLDDGAEVPYRLVVSVIPPEEG